MPETVRAAPARSSHYDRCVRTGVCAAVTGLLVAAAATACGGSSHHETTPVRAGDGWLLRLDAAGYAVKGDVLTGGLRPAPLNAFSVHDVDYTSPASFSVVVYRFRTSPLAARFVGALRTELSAYAGPSRTFWQGHVLRHMGTRAVLAFTEMDFELCRYVGLCAAYTQYGIPSCSAPGRCTPVPAVPAGDLADLVARAEGR